MGLTLDIMANNVDQDQTAPWSSLILVYTVCTVLSMLILKVNASALESFVYFMMGLTFDRMTNIVDQDQTAPWRSLILVYTACTVLYQLLQRWIQRGFVGFT